VQQLATQRAIGPRQRRLPPYAPYAAHKRAELRGRRPKPSKLEHRPLTAFVHAKMDLKWSPQQISDELARTHAGQVEMQVSHEMIYQALYVQGRGHLRADLHKQLRTGRAMRRPHGSADAAKANLTDVVSISERPAEADDRAVPGHWEGDLILGTNCRSAIGTLVERTTRFVLLVHLPDGHSAPAVRDDDDPCGQLLARAAASLIGLGPRHRARQAPRHHPGDRPGHLLLRPAQPLAARQ